MDFRRAGLVLGALVAVATLGVAPAWTGTPVKRRATPVGIQRPARIATIDNQRRIDSNRINMFVTNYGSFAWDISGSGSPPGLFFPKGSNKSAVFAAGIWLGAAVDTDLVAPFDDPVEIRTVVAEYSQEYGPGPMEGGTFVDPSLPQHIVYKVVRFTGDLDAVEGDTAHVEREPNDAAIEDPLVHHSWSEYMAGAVPYGAPWRIYQLPNPAVPGGTVDVPGPDVVGDMMMWAVYNDADPGNHTNDAGGSTPLGVEIQQKTFAFNRQGALGNVIFLEFKILNKGTNVLDSVFVSLWSDTDLGGAADDLVGCDTLLSLGYTYNSTNNDQLYGSAPPAVGYDFFLGPTDALGNPLPMTSFNKYINGTDPAATSETYNYMKGLLPDGSPVIDPTTGDPTNFFHPGDPTTRTGWLDSSPADRRHLLTSGPFQMIPGDTQTVVGALVIGDGNDRLSSIAAMKFYDDFAQLAFDEGFQLPNPPPQPNVAVNVDHGRVTLSWDPAARNSYSEPGYTFEGYNIYQGASASGPWTRLATFDEINGILTVRDTVFDVETGRTIADFPVAFGTDAGVRFTYTTDQDAIRGGPLKDGTEYFFAVTAYAYSPTEKLAILENAQEPITVMPQRPALGTDPGTASTAVTQSRIDPLRPPATDVVNITVVDPAAVTGHDYRIVFTPLFPPYPLVAGDTVKVAWNLLDVTTGDTLLFRQLNRTGDDDYQVVDGLLIQVVGANVPAFQDAVYLNNNAAHRRAYAGVGAGLEFFGGGAGLMDSFFGSTLNPTAHPDSFTSVEIRYNSTATQRLYRYLRLEVDGTGGAPNGDREYRYGGFHTVPFQIWDSTNNIQLDGGFVEKTVTDATGSILGPGSQPATHDSTWRLPTDDLDLGGREYVAAFLTPYSDTPKPFYEADVFDEGLTPGLYAMWVHLRAATDVVDDGDVFKFIWANPATANDVYDISTSQLVRNDAAVASGRLNGIRAVPNPYYNRSRYELNQFARVIRFINMPELATVRLFNLGGELVRTLNKTDASSSVLDWDLLTAAQLPVASGVYIFHVESSTGETSFGRLVVFMEKERLNNF
ncbi:MAG TPA: hypothetical protein VEY91_12740 [Candidatus Limnocylindria bacterium]|nr:hypothetical protein [Candidatus Limnocylindria bacterium]